MKKDTKKNAKSVTKRSSKRKSQHTKSKSKTSKHRSQSIRSVNTQQPVVFGRIYADWCGHCKSMEHDWTRLCSIVGNKIECVNIESKTQDTDIPSFNQKYNTNLALDSGYPTIFRLHKVGQSVENYPNDQTRDYESLKRWLYSKPEHRPPHASYYGGEGEGEGEGEKKKEDEHPTDATSPSALETVGETAKNAATTVQNMAESLTGTTAAASAPAPAPASAPASASSSAPTTENKPWWKFWSGGKKTRKNKKRNQK